MTPVGVFFTAIFPLVINGQALCQQLQFETQFDDVFRGRWMIFCELCEIMT